jgi:hypothetical protein
VISVNHSSGSKASMGGKVAAKTAATSARAPLGLQLKMLFRRSWRQVSRDKAAIKLRVATAVQSAVVFGCIWWRLRRLQQSVLSRLGLLQVFYAFVAIVDIMVA